MSGIVNSLLNHHGSGIISNVGTDGQLLTSTGSGLSQGFEAVAASGKIVQCIGTTANADDQITGTNVATSLSQAITPTSASNKILVVVNTTMVLFDDNYKNVAGGLSLWRDIAGGGYSEISSAATGDSDVQCEFFSQNDSEASGYFLWHDRWNLEWIDDTHNTTSAITYKIYASRIEAGDNYFDLGQGSQLRTITCWEIDGS